MGARHGIKCLSPHPIFAAARGGGGGEEGERRGRVGPLPSLPRKQREG